MKVVIIKECKDGKVNDIVEVSDGYAKNFLIKKGLALPMNKKTATMQKRIVRENNEAKDVREKKALDAKKVIEAITLTFKLKSDGSHVHGSITKKNIVKELFKKNVKLSPHAISNVHINTLGKKEISVSLGESIFAKLKVEVESE